MKLEKLNFTCNEMLIAFTTALSSDVPLPGNTWHIGSTCEMVHMGVTT